MARNTFSQDVEFLRQHVETVVLSDEHGAAVAIVPAYQGRTMTSTAGGSAENSYGWINYELIKSGKIDPVVNLFGGEDRFWISPEGGQFSVFFDPEAPLEFEHWRCPKIIDTEPFELVSQSENSISFRRNGSVTSRDRFRFDLQLEREVRLLTREEIAAAHSIDMDGLAAVGHESLNSITNSGSHPWTKENGLISVWILNMNAPSPSATVVIPFKPGEDATLGPPVNADYFNKLDEQRLQVDRQKSLIYFLGDGKLRSKLGLTYQRAKPTMGAWDPDLGALSIVSFNLPDSETCPYTNNLWEIQEDPFCGDVINSYNDGPNESGGMLGPFYELETLSPALELQPGDQYTHQHRTVRLEGERAKLDRVSQTVFGVSLDEIESKFNVN